MVREIGAAARLMDIDAGLVLRFVINGGTRLGLGHRFDCSGAVVRIEPWAVSWSFSFLASLPVPPCLSVYFLFVRRRGGLDELLGVCDFGDG